MRGRNCRTPENHRPADDRRRLLMPELRDGASFVQDRGRILRSWRHLAAKQSSTPPFLFSSWSCLARPSTNLLASTKLRPSKLVDGRTKSDHDGEVERPRECIAKSKSPGVSAGAFRSEDRWISYASFRLLAACLPRSLTTSKLTF